MGTNLGTKRITDSVINSLKTTSKEKWIRIEEGLYLRLRNGKKYFVSIYSFDGKNQKITLGEYPALKLMQARKMNLEIKEKILNGIDPLKERELEKQIQLESKKLNIEENLNKCKFEDIVDEWLAFKEQNIADVIYYKLLSRVSPFEKKTKYKKFKIKIR